MLSQSKHYTVFFLSPRICHCRYNITLSGWAALTPSEHEGTLAHAVVIVHILGAEVCSMNHQTALSARSPTVALQEQPMGGGEGGE